MSPPPQQFGRRPNCQVSRKRDTRRNFRLELDFRRALRHVPRRQRPGLRALLRHYTRTLHQPDPDAARPTAELPGVARARHTRTFYQLDPATGHWKRL